MMQQWGAETVIITPQGGLDANDDPLPAGTPFTLNGLVAPSTTTIQPGADSDLDTVDFTVYLPLLVERPSGWIRTVTALTGNFTVTVRGVVCVGRVREWDDSGFGGVEIVATGKSGATP